MLSDMGLRKQGFVTPSHSGNQLNSTIRPDALLPVHGHLLFRQSFALAVKMSPSRRSRWAAAKPRAVTQIVADAVHREDNVAPQEQREWRQSPESRE
jgi:hypothetical protein